MKVSLLNGRLGKHRFHMMLVHFPSALFPFAFILDALSFVLKDETLANAGLYSLEGAVGMSVVAMIYGLIDFLQIDSQSRAWKTAGLHALLNVCWLINYSALLFYQLKHEAIGGLYLIVMGLTTGGMIFSNYLGAELVIKYKIGIEEGKSENEPKK